jgi:hypothetical protein
VKTDHDSTRCAAGGTPAVPGNVPGRRTSPTADHPDRAAFRPPRYAPMLRLTLSADG